MSDVKLLALQSKKTMLRTLLLENELHPNPETKARISQFLPTPNSLHNQWTRSISNTIPYLKDANGNLTSSHNDMCLIAASHLKSLYQNQDTCSEAEIETYLSKLNLPKFTTEEKDALSNPFTLEEFEDIIKSMPAGKSNGKDNIPIDLFKNSTELRSILLACANNTFQGDQPLPQSLRSVLFRLIPKDSEKDPADLDNYRPIGLLSMAYRIISKAVTTRLQPVLSRLIGPHQFAYVSGRRSENIGRIISEMMMQTITEPDSNIITLKLDFRKAFDSVSYQYIRVFLRTIDTPIVLGNFIMKILTCLNGAVIINNGYSDSFLISRGTTQGSALSAILFVLCLEGLCCVAIASPNIYGAARIPKLNLSLALMAFADDLKIFTVLQCISAWLSLLSQWGSLSGVIPNIPKCLLNFWSFNKNAANVPALQQLLLTHPCPAYSKAGIFNSLTNKNGWRIGENADFSILGLRYSFDFQTSEFDFQNENFNVHTNNLISFSSDTWNLKDPTKPDPRIKFASAIHAASDNMFDRLVDLKTLFVSGLIFRFYNCPCTTKTMITNQNQANVVLLSSSALRTPYIKLNTLLQSLEDGGCHHVSIQSIQKSISVHTIILLLSGTCDRWINLTYRRDLLRIVHANCLRNEAMKYLPYDSISHAGLHYLFGLPLISSHVLNLGTPMLWTNYESVSSTTPMLWTNYESLSSFISIPKNTISNLCKQNNAPTSQDLTFFSQLLLQPLWLNNIFLNPTTSRSISPTSLIVDLFLFRDIWSIPQCSILIPTHKTNCSPSCSHDPNCCTFWTSCIPPSIIEFATWCSPHYIHNPQIADTTHNESSMFTLQILPPMTHDATPLAECSVKLLTAYYTSLRAGPANVNMITGVQGWMRHWPHFNNNFTWKAYFELLVHPEIDKSVRDAYWKLLHRCNIPKAKNSLNATPYIDCKFCTMRNNVHQFNPCHAIFECPSVLQFWQHIITYVLKINPNFDHNLSFLTIISLGLHNMEHGQNCHINIRTATHNIIGLGIKTLSMYPVDSSKSTQASLVSFRQQFQHFIKTTVDSKINDHLSKHGPDPDLYPALRSSLARELSIWTTLRDMNPASLYAPTWSDYFYVDPV